MVSVSTIIVKGTMMNTSKASDATDYINLQIRTETGDTFKVQGAGKTANRPYGVSDKVTVSPGYGIGEYVKGLTATESSLAGGSSPKYVLVQAAIRANMIHFQLTGPAFCADNPNELSREYGAIFNILVDNAPALAEFVHTNGSGLGGGTDFQGTDDDPDGEDSWGPSSYNPDEVSGECQCSDCDEMSTPSDGSPKTVVIDGVTYTITPIE